ncbi:MAG: hypothetical protein WC753_00375 [Candidatus Gracilibacteria bacterium]
MRPPFSHFLCYISCCVCLAYSLPTFAEGCSLSDTSSSPIQSYKKNIDTLNTFIRQQASTSSCESGQSLSAVSLMQEVSAFTSRAGDVFTQSSSFLDPAGPVNELKPHRENIEEIERSILDTTQYVGSRCAGGQKITEDAFQGKGGYDTRGRTISNVLDELARETNEVKRFFGIIGQGIQADEYIDEVPFPIASPGFSADMYVYFSPKKIQECRDNSPRKKAFMEMLKSAFTTGWKYPQAIQVWKDAMALLLYRGSSLAGGPADAVKDAEIERIVQARRGGLGNSGIVINSQFFKEYGYRPKSQTPQETQQEMIKRVFFARTGYDFIRRVIPSLVAQEGGTGGSGYIKNIQTTEELDKIARWRAQDEANYDRYHNRKKTLVDAEALAENANAGVNTVDGTKEREKTFTEITKTIDQGIDPKQGRV